LAWGPPPTQRDQGNVAKSEGTKEKDARSPFMNVCAPLVGKEGPEAEVSGMLTKKGVVKQGKHKKTYQ